MKKPGPNDPYPCGSGKKYKQCCLKAEENRLANDRSEAVPRALQWLSAKHGPAVREALDNGFFGGLDDEEYEMLQDQHGNSFDGIMVNAMEWLVADGTLSIKDQDRRVAELLLGRGGPLFSVQQRQWIELLTAQPLRLYEVIDVVPGECMSLKDVMLPEQSPVLVREKTGSQQAVQFDLIAARILPVEDHFELSGAVYSFPRNLSWDLIAELREELEGVATDSSLAKEITAVIIPYHWLKLFVSAFEIPQLVDHVTGEPLLFIADHYRVQDWAALKQALSGEADLKGNPEDGWNRFFKGEDGLRCSSLRIDPGKRPDRVKVSYRTQGMRMKGAPGSRRLQARRSPLSAGRFPIPKGCSPRWSPVRPRNLAFQSRCRRKC